VQVSHQKEQEKRSKIQFDMHGIFKPETQ